VRGWTGVKPRSRFPRHLGADGKPELFDLQLLCAASPHLLDGMEPRRHAMNTWISDLRTTFALGVEAPTMTRLGGMMMSVVHKQVIEQVGRALDRSGVPIDPNAETVTGYCSALSVIKQMPPSGSGCRVSQADQI
jgi:hypothetical protein